MSLTTARKVVRETAPELVLWFDRPARRWSLLLPARRRLVPLDDVDLESEGRLRKRIDEALAPL